MADKKITQLTDLGDSLASVDLFHVVDDPAGTPINKKIAAEDVFNNIPTYLGLAQTSQTLTMDSSSQVADVTSAITELNAASAPGTVTLADGTNGQVKTILITTGSNAVTITPSNLSGHTSVVLNALGESVTLMFKSSNWNIIAGHGYTTV